MVEKHDRRRFLQTTLAAGSALALTSDALQSDATATGPATPAQQAANPTVRPGLIRWHEDFAAACAASERSGKPVFLFHMMGRLDQRFC